MSTSLSWYEPNGLENVLKQYVGVADEGGRQQLLYESSSFPKVCDIVVCLLFVVCCVVFIV